MVAFQEYDLITGACFTHSKNPLHRTHLRPGFGCFALSGDKDILTYTAWGISTSKYTNAEGDRVGQVAYIALRKFVVYTCADASSSDYHQWGDCSIKAVWWSAATCSNGEDEYYGFPCSAVRNA